MVFLFGFATRVGDFLLVSTFRNTLGCKSSYPIDICNLIRNIILVSATQGIEIHYLRISSLQRERSKCMSQNVSFILIKIFFTVINTLIQQPRWINRGKTSWNRLLSFVVIGHVFLNAMFSIFLLCVAGSNYAGGVAITRLHKIEKNSVTPIFVHIDNLSAQTGVSRFTQINSSWM